MQDTHLLFQNIKDGKYSVFISNLTEEELENAPYEVKNLLNDLEHQLIVVSPECKNLAKDYINEMYQDPDEIRKYVFGEITNVWAKK
ncbi:MAG: hypothetical protein LBH98_00065 [Chitinispirillales bacterium]|nr:hypothetical protein [Chitinispirillales bacterium]